ncbi:SDR family NAD(P)-dependent oxidoreductase [Rhodoferax sp.]|uniref:SDR family NAD(P)-dependent oxidoreductase n=1 Tax=Rhodoferax sp. TaxID=50421 RepID=UPI0026163680|nr:SDR family NAD(P)-dependent oxidoreductase [Rhodoferax sp.]MDD2808510.1 SDR family NAD(P)-dependent oxidoreductase [Rhodoferax sp.]MDD4944720.1 SDR family NAD(P)-dependent oxidoreductase [Rhodoferax sp.]
MNPPAHLYILTGASRGMGLAMAEQLLAPTHQLLCISRHTQPALAKQALAAACALEQWALDLGQAAAAAQQLTNWLKAQPLHTLQSATLINNAGVIPTLSPLAQCPADDLTQALRVGLEAPMLLTAAFVSATGNTPGLSRKVLNISSGLGRRAMASQAAYCAAKAGMDHFSRCLALDEARQPHGAKVCSLAPGVIDTDMQTQLRTADAANFPDQANFAHLKQTGALASPHQAAQRVLAWLHRPDFGQQVVADVRDAG